MSVPMNQPDQPQIPNSFNQGMATLLAEALTSALTPIVERLDRIEAYQHNYMKVDYKGWQQLSASLLELADSLRQENLEYKGEVETLSAQVENLTGATTSAHQQIASLEQNQGSLTQDYNNLVTVLTSWSTTWNQVTELMQELKIQELQRQRQIIMQDKQIDNLNRSYQQLASLKQDTLNLSLSYNKLVTILTPWSSAWNQAVDLMENLKQGQESSRVLVPLIHQQIDSHQQNFNSLLKTLTPLSSTLVQLVEQMPPPALTKQES